MNWREIVVDAVWYALGGDREEEMGWKAEEDGAQSGSNSSRRGESGTNKNARPRQKKGNNETGEREREVEVEVEEKRKRGRERERDRTRWMWILECGLSRELNAALYTTILLLQLYTQL